MNIGKEAGRFSQVQISMKSGTIEEIGVVEGSAGAVENLVFIGFVLEKPNSPGPVESHVLQGAFGAAPIFFGR